MIELKKYPSKDLEGKKCTVTIASGPVIIQDQKVLLVKSGKDDFWKFPGGGNYDNESPRQTTKRECKEELGIEIEVQGEPYVLSFSREKGDTIQYILHFHYKATLSSNEIVPADDTHEWAWLDINNRPANCGPNIEPAVKYFAD